MTTINDTRIPPPKREESYEKVKNERDTLLPLCKEAQARVEELERALKLLILAGHVTEERVSQARSLAKT